LTYASSVLSFNSFSVSCNRFKVSACLHWAAQALLNSETSIVIRKRHFYTTNSNSEMSGDSKNASLHCGDILCQHCFTRPSAYLQLHHNITIGSCICDHHQLPVVHKKYARRSWRQQCSHDIDGGTLLLFCNTVMSQVKTLTSPFPAGDICIQMGCSVDDA